MMPIHEHEHLQIYLKILKNENESKMFIYSLSNTIFTARDLALQLTIYLIRLVVAAILVTKINNLDLEKIHKIKFIKPNIFE